VSNRIKKDLSNDNILIQPPILSSIDYKNLDDAVSSSDLPLVFNAHGKLNTKKITIGMVGDTASRKNPDMFPVLAQLFPQYNFLWIGGEKNYFQKAKNFYHIPYTHTPYLYYRYLDYLLLTSKEDPCPYVVLENLYMNNKVITFKNNIYTNHNSSLLKDLYYEFDGEVSLDNAQHMINEHVKEKNTIKTQTNGKEYILNHFQNFHDTFLNIFIK
jgi:hypothetical protein